MSHSNSEREAGSRDEGNNRNNARQLAVSFQQHVAGQKAVPAHATLAKARSVDVTGFVEARSFEINALQRSLESAKASRNARAFQTLPRHLRRRAASHNVKRVPVRLREKAMSEMKKSAQSSKTLGESGKLTNAKKSNRYKRRRAKSVREEYQLRQTNKRWLETHVWHAKRMHMKEIWGTMIADSPNERSHRAAYHAAMEKTYLQDVSFYRTVELIGPAEAITQLVQCLAAPGDLTIAMTCYASGSRMAPLLLYRAGQYPLAMLGPASALWRPANGDQLRTLWIRIHPAIADSVISELAGAKAVVAGPDAQYPRINDISSNLVSLELLGNQSTSMLATVLAHATDPESLGSSILQSIRTLPSPATVPESIVIALRIHDPRLHFPFKLDPAGSELLPEQQRRLEEIMLRWPADSASLSETNDGGVWDYARCAIDLESRPAEHSLNERRHAQLIPGAKLEPDPSIDVTVPLILVRTGPESLLGTRVIENGNQLVDNLAHGWTVIAPRGWGMSLWVALNFAGARAQGLQERHHIGFEAGLPTFPANWPGTDAYDRWAGAIATDDFGRWSRLPPGKRPNYLQMGIETPFYSPFHRLLGMTHAPPAYPQISADSLQCRMRRLRKIRACKAALGASPADVEDGSNDAEMASVSGEEFSSADMWLVTGERLSDVVKALLTTPSQIDCDMKPDLSFLQWSEPLLSAVRRDNIGTLRDLPRDMQLIDHCLVRVRLICSGRGVPSKNAPIYASTCTVAAMNQRADSELLDPKGAAVIGYVMTGSFSLARGCGMAIGACSLRGLFRLWEAGATGNLARSSRARSPRVAINSMSGGPCIEAILTIIL
ncbi:Ribonucleases P/MRP protein subunit pop1 [Coemansia thaxteri]|nr:Ribonucleases P/MRP protein subunit pop1 [Coemansia thaxteri]KAJ2474161.1 Ribonucleases P/MRP protein subunit pop1 [Coemansia sp. RSA 2322]